MIFKNKVLTEPFFQGYSKLQHRKLETIFTILRNLRADSRHLLWCSSIKLQCSLVAIPATISGQRLKELLSPCLISLSEILLILPIRLAWTHWDYECFKSWEFYRCNIISDNCWFVAFLLSHIFLFIILEIVGFKFWVLSGQLFPITYDFRIGLFPYFQYGLL